MWGFISCLVFEHTLQDPSRETRVSGQCCTELTLIPKETASRAFRLQVPHPLSRLHTTGIGHPDHKSSGQHFRPRTNGQMAYYVRESVHGTAREIYQLTDSSGNLQMPFGAKQSLEGGWN